jgi:hypothetical protein
MFADVFLDRAVQGPSALVLQPVSRHHAMRAGFVRSDCAIEFVRLDVVPLALFNEPATLGTLVLLLGCDVLSISQHSHLPLAVVDHAHVRPSVVDVFIYPTSMQ